MRESLAQASGIGSTPPVSLPLSLPLTLPRSRTLPLTLTLIVARAQAGAAAVPYISIYLLYLPISPYQAGAAAVPEQLAALLAALLADTVLEVR